MRKSAPISFRLPQDLKAALEKLAKADQRSLSAYIAIALRKHVEATAGAKASAPRRGR